MADMIKNIPVADEEKEIIAVVVSYLGKMERTGIFVPVGNAIYTYTVVMSNDTKSNETKCIVTNTDVSSQDNAHDIVMSFIRKYNRNGQACRISVGNIENAADLCIQAHAILGLKVAKTRNLLVRYDFDIQSKVELLKRLVKAPLDSFDLDIPCSCGEVVGSVIL